MSKMVYILYKISNWLYLRKVLFLPKIITLFIRIIFSGWIPASAKIGKHCKFGKGGLGIVIHEQAEIGDCCIISHNVTIAGASKKERNKLPRIGNSVRIGAAAVILGDVDIGDEVIIAASAVVIRDVPSQSIVAGNPAKVIKSNININDFVDFDCEEY